jgi:hypothetical protein
MEYFRTLDSLEILLERFRRNLSIEQDEDTRAKIQANLERVERAIVEVPVTRNLKLENIKIEKLYSEGSMGFIWLVS